MNPDKERLNPDIKEVKVGVRRLRTIKLYPLSAKDQFELTDLVAGGIQHFLSLGQNISNVDFVKESFAFFREHVGKILKLVTDEKERGDDILAELTNNQMTQIGEIIYSVNFETLQKKVSGLLKAVQPTTVSPLKRSPQPSSEDTLNTTSAIFTDEPIEKEDLPSDKSESSSTTRNPRDGMI